MSRHSIVTALETRHLS